MPLPVVPVWAWAETRSGFYVLSLIPHRVSAANSPRQVHVVILRSFDAANSPQRRALQILRRMFFLAAFRGRGNCGEGRAAVNLPGDASDGEFAT